MTVQSFQPSYHCTQNHRSSTLSIKNPRSIKILKGILRVWATSPIAKKTLNKQKTRHLKAVSPKLPRGAQAQYVPFKSNKLYPSNKNRWHSLFHKQSLSLKLLNISSKWRKRPDWKGLQSLFKDAQALYEPSQILFTYPVTSSAYPSRAPELTEPQLNNLISQLYARECCKEQVNGSAFLTQQDRLAMKAVSLPAFFNRSLILSGPKQEHLNEIVQQLYMDSFTLNQDNTVEDLIKHRGYLKKNLADHHLIILRSSDSSRLLGAIHFKIESIAKQSLSCYIYSLKVKSKERKQGYGSLLLLYAIKSAQGNHCRTINLKSSESAFSYYINMGFIVDTDEIESYEEWENMSDEEKENLAYRYDHQLILELDAEPVEELIDARVEKIIEKDYFSQV